MSDEPAPLRQFEQLLAWQRARELAAAIYLITSKAPLRRDRSLVDQLRRAAVSVMANVAEGHERGSPGDFHHFLGIAKASAAEVRSHLYIARDVGYLEEEDFTALRDRAEEVGRIIGGLRVSVAKRREGRP